MSTISSDRKFAVGCKVKLCNLTSKPEDNGREGIVDGWDDGAQRYLVSLPSREKPFKIAEAKLELVPSKVKEVKQAAPKEAPAAQALPASGGLAAAAGRDRSRSPRREPQIGANSRPAPRPGPREVTLSRALSRVLRHSAESQGLIVRPDGYCEANAVLALSDFRNLQASLSDLESAVRNSDKQRFQMTTEDGEVFIRATQGHSIKSVGDAELLQPLTTSDPNLPETCVHGTYMKFKDAILQQGLLAGGGVSKRKHVHFAPFEPGDGRVISGVRNNCEIAVYLDLLGALKGGIPFFRSANDVILSPGREGVVPKEYIVKVKDLKSGDVLYTKP